MVLLMKFLFLLSLLFNFSLACASVPKGNPKSFTVMTYNLENLFDITHDEGKSDYTWLPLKVKQNSIEIQRYCSSIRSTHYRRNCLELDWNLSTYRAKIKNLSKVISSFDGGKGADILVFEEVENINALKDLVKYGLKSLGYKHFSLIEGPDSRGIDVGMISRYPIISEVLHKVDLSDLGRRKKTRGILETNFKVGKKKIVVFGNHWPSQGNSDATRLRASEVLAQKATDSDAEIVLALGDFNQKPDDSPHGINRNILPIFEDVEILGRKISRETSPGTHWYRGEWTSLDKIFILKRSLKNNVYIDYSSYDILNKNFMIRDLIWIDFETGAENQDENIPWRFDAKKHVGFSDHLPVGIKINL